MARSKRKTNLFMRAFTLLEIMVVISIAGLIVSIGTFSYSQINKNSRDATRKADLQNISQALELYRSNHLYGSYPMQSTWKIDLTAGGYLSEIPTDPKTKLDYTYTATCAGTPSVCGAYVLSADLESSTEDYIIGPYGK